MNFMYTDLLYARPSALEGAARLLDLGGTLTQYNAMQTPEEADMAAIRSDWSAVGEDLRVAMKKFASEMEAESVHVEQGQSHRQTS